MSDSHGGGGKHAEHAHGKEPGKAGSNAAVVASLIAVVFFGAIIVESCSGSSDSRATEASHGGDAAGTVPGGGRHNKPQESVLDRALRPDAIARAINKFPDQLKEQYLFVRVDGGVLRPAVDEHGDPSRDLYIPATHDPLYVRMVGKRWTVEVHRREERYTARGDRYFQWTKVMPEPIELRVAGESRWRDERKGGIGALSFREFEIRLPADYRPHGDEYFYLAVDKGLHK